MAYNNNKRNNFNGNRGVKPITITMPVVVSGVDRNNRNYDVDSCYQLLTKIQESGAFDMLSIDATLAKSICFDNPEAKGTVSVARIMSYENGNITLTFFGKNTTYVEKVNGLEIIPKIRTNKEGTVITILGFEIV